MAELRGFEDRLEAALGQYADEVDTSVDAAALAHATVIAHPRRRRWAWPWGVAPGGNVRLAARVLLGVALILATVAALLIGQRLFSIVGEPTFIGRMRCPDVPAALRGPSPDLESLASSGAVLACYATTSLPRAGGPSRIEVRFADEPNGMAEGTMTISGPDGDWTGSLILATLPNGVTTGDALLAGPGASAGHVLQVHLLSGDGVEWSLTGGRTDAR